VAFPQGEQRHERLGTSAITSVLTRVWLVWCYAECGEFAAGRALSAEAVRMAEEADHPFSVIIAYWIRGVLFLSQGDLQQAMPALERGLGLCQTWDLPLWFLWNTSALGAAYVLAGCITEALQLLEQVLERATVQGLMQDQARRVAWLSEALLLDDRLEEACALAARALELSQVHGERGNQAWVLRLLGEILARQEPPEVASAKACYRQALALAEQLGLRPLQAHYHRGLGTLYSQTGQTAPARAALSTAIALYHAMDMTLWLPQAEAALAQVNASG
jgi:tetratricopeptide (TPR) repeat protein